VDKIKNSGLKFFGSDCEHSLVREAAIEVGPMVDYRAREAPVILASQSLSITALNSLDTR
jgi:hypothetical protein